MQSGRLSILAAACGAAVFGAVLLAPAHAEEAQAAADAPQFTVLEENARIPFRRQINGFRAEDDGLLLRVGVNNWYHATLNRSCARDLRFEENLPLIESGGTGIDKFAHVVVNGRPCYFESFDRIADPDAPGPQAAQ